MKAIDKKAYELAKRVLETVDWKNCDERRVLVVELKDGRRRFVSFLGSEGCFRAISLFADAAGFARLAMAESDDALSIFDAFGSVEQLQLAFCPKEDLMPGEAEWIAASGLAFPDEFQPSFISHLPGYVQWNMTERDVLETMEFLAAILDFLKTGTEIRMKVAVNTALTTWREVGPGEWKVEVDDFPPFKHFTYSTEQEKIDRVAALPQKDMWLQFGAVPFAPVDQYEGRPMLPRLAQLVERESLFLLGTKIIFAENGQAFDYNLVIDWFLDTLLEKGFRPSRLSVWGLDLAPIMKQFAPVLGIEYAEDKECRELHQVYGEFVELMKSQQGGR